MVLLTFWSFQETTEFEVANMDGKTPDALTVRTQIFMAQIKMNTFQTTKGTQNLC